MMRSPWPLLVALEIKHQGIKPTDRDLEKLRTLRSLGRTEWGLWLHMYNRRAEPGSGLDWGADAQEPNVLTCGAKLRADFRSERD